jgi:hypothetical protein
MTRGPRYRWTDADHDLLRRLYPDTPAAEVARQIGVTRTAVAQKVGALGIRKSETALAELRRVRIARLQAALAAGRGRALPIVPWNKGMRGLPGHQNGKRFEAGVRMGAAKKNWMPVGSERLDDEGYLRRKIRDDGPRHLRWRGVHQLLWEEAHGPVPPGFAVCFIDGDRRHLALDNLALVSRADLMRRNSVTNYGPAIAGALQAIGKLKKQLLNQVKESA